ncbi:MAG: GNAT family acetyltransferase [Verrucomicrobiota bacterium]
MAAKKEVKTEIRFYEPKDREGVRHVCCGTGFLGKPIDSVFEDRDIFADFLTAYYTDCEPELTVVVLQDGQVQGYIMGSRFPERQKVFEMRMFPLLAARIVWNYFFVYGSATRRYINWLLLKGRKETPYTPKGMAHVHFNFLPEYRNVAQTRKMFDMFLRKLADYGEDAVFGQVVGFEDRRGPRMFARYGFSVRDKVEVTKFSNYVDHPVFLFTIIKNLKENVALYGNDLWRAGELETKS